MDKLIRNLEDSIICAICTGILEDPVTTACSHSFCHDCYDVLKTQYSDQHRAWSRECPVCRTKLWSQPVRSIMLKNVAELVISSSTPIVTKGKEEESKQPEVVNKSTDEFQLCDMHYGKIVEASHGDMDSAMALIREEAKGCLECSVFRDKEFAVEEKKIVYESEDLGGFDSTSSSSGDSSDDGDDVYSTDYGKPVSRSKPVKQIEDDSDSEDLLDRAKEPQQVYNIISHGVVVNEAPARPKKQTARMSTGQSSIIRGIKMRDENNSPSQREQTKTTFGPGMRISDPYTPPTSKGAMPWYTTINSRRKSYCPIDDTCLQCYQYFFDTTELRLKHPRNDPCIHRPDAVKATSGVKRRLFRDDDEYSNKKVAK